MYPSVTKRVALSAIAAGLRPPGEKLERITELVHLRKLLELQSINCVVDVGANRGQFATEIRGIGYRGRIISFEPLSSEFGVLGQRFRNDALWTGHQVALGDTPGKALLNVIPNLTVMSSILRPKSKWKSMEVEEVEVRRLDGMASQLFDAIPEPRVLLKMDTQGFDLRVFEGASGCLDVMRGLQSEIAIVPLYDGMPRYLEALSVYESKGFGLFNLSVVSRTRGGTLQELNCMMTR